MKIETLKGGTVRKREALVFAQEYGDEYVQPDDAEALKAGIAFKDAVADTMLRHMEDVWQFDAEDSLGLEPRAELSLLRRA